MKVRAATKLDLDGIVYCHIRCFSDFFLAKLGRRFLYQYYLTYINNSHFCYVAVDADDTVVGLCFGYKCSNTFSSDLKKNKARFIIPLLFSLVNFSVWKELLVKSVAFTSSGKVNSDYIQPVGIFELSSLAVDNRYQGQGIGKKLVDIFFKSAIREGAKGVCLLTDETDNKAVMDFYVNLGFKKATTFKQSQAREMALFVKT